MVLDYEVRRGDRAATTTAGGDGWSSGREELQRTVDDFAK
jgi:hypothetical protein